MAGEGRPRAWLWLRAHEQDGALVRHWSTFRMRPRPRAGPVLSAVWHQAWAEARWATGSRQSTGAPRTEDGRQKWAGPEVGPAVLCARKGPGLSLGTMGQDEGPERGPRGHGADPSYLGSRLCRRGSRACRPVPQPASDGAVGARLRKDGRWGRGSKSSRERVGRGGWCARGGAQAPPLPASSGDRGTAALSLGPPSRLPVCPSRSL